MEDTESTSSSLPPLPPLKLPTGLATGVCGGDLSTMRGGVYDLASPAKLTLDAGLAGLSSLSSFGGVVYPLREHRDGDFFFLEIDRDFSKLSFKIFVVTSRWCRRELFVSRSSGVGDRPRSRIMSSSSEVPSVPEPTCLSSDPLGERARTSAQASRFRGGEVLLARARGFTSRPRLLCSCGEKERCDPERELARSACSLLISSRLSREKCVPRAR